MNNYIARIKKIEELDEEVRTVIFDNSELKEMFEKYGGTVQKFIEFQDEKGKFYYNEKIKNDCSLWLDNNDRYFFINELVFLHKQISIKIDDDLFKME